MGAVHGRNLRGPAVTCAFCGNALPWAMGPTTCDHCRRFQHVDSLSMQREYNRLLSQQNELLRLVPVAQMRPELVQELNEASGEAHWFAPGAAVCNCGQRRFEDAAPAAPPGWPGEPGKTPCVPGRSSTTNPSDYALP